MRLFLYILLFCLLTVDPTTAANISRVPYNTMLDEQISFSGVKESSLSPSAPIVFGLFLSSTPVISDTVLKAAHRAINEANSSGGFQGRPFKLIPRSATSPWQQGPSEIIHLAYSDKARIIFTLFSEDSHIAAQIAAKAYVPIIAILTGDPTLNQARLPWIFRMIADYTIQAEVLLEQCPIDKRSKIGVLSTISQDPRLAAKGIISTLTKKGYAPLFHHQLVSEKYDWAEIGNTVASIKPDVLFITALPLEVKGILEMLNRNKITCPLYFSYLPGFDLEKAAQTYPGQLVTISPDTPTGEIEFYSPSLPQSIDSLVYDSVKMAIEAIYKTGLARTALRETLAETKSYLGKYNSYRFDNGGANILRPGLISYPR